MKVAKYKISAYFAVHTNNTLPPKPFESEDNPAILIGSTFYTWSRRFLQYATPKNRISFITSIKQSKKGMPRPGAVELSSALLATVKKLTTIEEERPELWLASWADMNEMSDKVATELTKETAIAQLRRRTRELLTNPKTGQPFEYTYEERVTGRLPSTNSTLNKTRAKGGALGAVLANGYILEGSMSDDEMVRRLTESLRKIGGVYDVNVERVTPDERRITAVPAKNGRRNEEDEEIELFTMDIHTANKDRMEAACREYWTRLWVAAKEEGAGAILVEPVALAESLKVRIITKSPALIQTLLKPIQVKLSRILRDHKTFKLTGEPQTEQTLLDGMGLDLKPDEFYLSGDYEAATDNLKSWATVAVWHEICDMLKIDAVERDLGARLLVQNTFELPRRMLKERPELEEFQGALQKTGQLMGVILSFVILCIVNGTVCGWAMEITKKKACSLRELPLMVNGDDCLMRGTKQLYSTWKTISQFFGLKESIGKTYFTRDFAEINSTTFERTVEPFEIQYPSRDGKSTILRKTYLRMTQYVNMGLIYGFKRSQGSAGHKETDARTNIGARARELIHLCPNSLRDKAMRLFLSHNRETLKTSNIPWYIPEWLGGYGLPSGPWGEASELDLRLAHQILINWKTKRPVPTNYTGVPWKIRQLAERRMPKPVWNTEKGPSTELYEQMIGRKCVDLMFDDSVSIGDLLDNGYSQKDVFRHNERIWRMPKRALPKPLTAAEIAYRARYPGYVTESIRPITAEAVNSRIVATNNMDLD